MINPVRTDMYCHHCTNNFIAQLDMGLDGNHAVECPYCGHHHYRRITAGVVTEGRFDSDTHDRIDVDRRCVWKSDSQPIVTSMTSSFLRDKWLNRSDWAL